MQNNPVVLDYKDAQLIVSLGIISLAIIGAATIECALLYGGYKLSAGTIARILSKCAKPFEDGV